jgi:hypothetical protein
MSGMTDPIPDPVTDPAKAPDLADRIQEKAEAFGRGAEAFGREAQARGEQLGREGQAAGERWANDPTIVHVANTASRAWGLILIAIGAWFFADVTLGYSLPTIAWRDLWPALLVVLGLFIIGRAMMRRA